MPPAPGPAPWPPTSLPVHCNQSPCTPLPPCLPSFHPPSLLLAPRAWAATARTLCAALRAAQVGPATDACTSACGGCTAHLASSHQRRMMSAPACLRACVSDPPTNCNSFPPRLARTALTCSSPAVLRPAAALRCPFSLDAHFALGTALCVCSRALPRALKSYLPSFHACMLRVAPQRMQPEERRCFA